MSPAIFGIGTVEARRSWMVGPTVAGRVLSVRVDVGDLVKAGQLLAEMDPVDLDQRLARSTPLCARRQHPGRSHSAGGRRHGPARTGHHQRQTQPGSGGAKLHQRRCAGSAPARKSLGRRRPAGGTGQPECGTAQDLSRAYRPSAPRWHSSAATCACWHRPTAWSPAATAEAGSTVVAGQPVLRLIDPASLWVKLRVDQGRSAGLAPGLKARIVLRSQPRTPLPGQVARVELLADA